LHFARCPSVVFLVRIFPSLFDVQFLLTKASPFVRLADEARRLLRQYNCAEFF
jgi:hypothetical protein